MKFSTGEIALPACYDATWRINPRLFGFRRGEHYGILSRSGRQVMACTLPALAVGFREITPAAVLEWVVAAGFGQLPPLQWVLGRLCYADLLRAEELTPQRPQASRLRQVLAWTAAVQQEVPVLAESGAVQLLTSWECADSNIDPPLPPPPANEDLTAAQAERWAAHRELRALLQSCNIEGPACRIAPEDVFDWVPYDVRHLPADALRRCHDHLRPHLNADDPQHEARRWQLVYLAWLAANSGLRHCPESGKYTVVERFAFDAGPFANRPLHELLGAYGLWDLAPWLCNTWRLL